MTEIITDNNLIASDIFRILTKGFSYPDEKNLQELAGISAELIATGNLDDSISSQLKKLLNNIDPVEIRREYSRIFITGAVPMTESNCLTNMNSVTDVSAFYKAFGLIPKSGDSPDSITYQLEFVALLFVKISLAKSPEQTNISMNALKGFISDHLEQFSKALAVKIREKNPCAFYLELTALLNLAIQKNKYY